MVLDGEEACVEVRLYEKDNTINIFPLANHVAATLSLCIWRGSEW